MKITSEQPDSTTNNVYKNTTIEKKISTFTMC